MPCSSESRKPGDLPENGFDWNFQETTFLVMLGLAVVLGVMKEQTLGTICVLVVLALAILFVGRRISELVETNRRRQSFEDADRERTGAILSVLERIAGALEESGVPGRSAETESDAPLREIRDAIREQRWEEVLERVESLRMGGNLSPEFEAEVDRHRETAKTDLRARMDASRQANDPVSVLEYRAQLVPLLAEEIRQQVDTDLIRWCMALLMKRMRAGTVRVDVAQLAESIAETFPATSEGASLRASLPTLRRSAGLCPRCAQPYAGEQDACPRCLGAASPAPENIENGDDDDIAPVERSEEDDPFLRRSE
ncbi:MAG TPA: hypothetical protein VFT74_00130 [Isosphaeraceae bacterium]|nr:hypothetical protein [Isosphaeraceae bacterium]